jgi:hypothetical protein
VQRWLEGQADGRRFRIDTFQGAPDVTFVRLAASAKDVADAGSGINDLLAAELATAGLDAPDKVSLVYYDGDTTYACAAASWPPLIPGRLGALYLQGAVPGFDACAVNTFAAADEAPRYWEFSALHELLHVIGAVAACAPNHHRNGHVSDTAADLMWAGDGAWQPAVLDAGHDDYYRHGNDGCFDLDSSGWLTAPVAPAPPSPPGDPAPTAPGASPQPLPVPPPTPPPVVTLPPAPTTSTTTGGTAPAPRLVLAAPPRDRRAPFRFVLAGRVVAPGLAACRGTVDVRVALRRGRLVVRSPLRADCRFRLRVTVPAARISVPTRLVARVTVRGPSLTLAPRSVTLRVGA